MTTFEAVSPRLGEARYDDVRAQIGDSESGVILALTIAGQAIEFEVELTSSWWGAVGWRQMFACPVCGNSVLVLAVTSYRVGCARCVPRRTKQQLEKNTRAWREAKLVDRFIKKAIRDGWSSEELKREALLIKKRELKSLQSALSSTRLIIAASDELANSWMWSLRKTSFDVGDEAQLPLEVPLGPHITERWKRRRELG